MYPRLHIIFGAQIILCSSSCMSTHFTNIVFTDFAKIQIHHIFLSQLSRRVGGGGNARLCKIYQFGACHRKTKIMAMHYFGTWSKIQILADCHNIMWILQSILYWLSITYDTSCLKRTVCELAHVKKHNPQFVQQLIKDEEGILASVLLVIW